MLKIGFVLLLLSVSLCFDKSTVLATVKKTIEANHSTVSHRLVASSSSAISLIRVVVL